MVISLIKSLFFRSPLTGLKTCIQCSDKRIRELQVLAPKVAVKVKLFCIGMKWNSESGMDT